MSENESETRPDWRTFKPGKRYFFMWEPRPNVPPGTADYMVVDAFGPDAERWGYTYTESDYWYARGVFPETFSCVPAASPVQSLEDRRGNGVAAVQEMIPALQYITISDATQPGGIWRSRAEQPFTRDVEIERGLQDGRLESHCYRVDTDPYYRDPNENVVGLELVFEKNLGIAWTIWFAKRLPVGQAPYLLGDSLVTFKKVTGPGELTGHDFYAKIGLAKAIS